MDLLIKAAIALSMVFFAIGIFLMQIMNFPNLIKENMNYRDQKIKPLSAPTDFSAALQSILKVYSEYFDTLIGRINYYIFLASATMFTVATIFVVMDIFV